MSSTKLIRRLHEHQTWVNHRLLDAATRLNQEQLERSLPIGQGSIWRSLLHLYAAEYVWLEALLGDADPVVPGDLPAKLPGNQEGAGAMASLPELKKKWSDLECRWDAYLAKLTPELLDGFVDKVSTSSGKGKTHRTRRADAMLHIYTHAQYTTAQLVNMLRHVGAESLPDVMLISLARQQMGPV